MGCTLCDVKKTVKSNAKKNLQRGINQKVMSRVVFEKMKRLGKDKPDSDLRESKNKQKRSISDIQRDEDALFEKMANAKSDEEIDLLIKEDIKNSHPDWDDDTIDFLIGVNPQNA